MRLDSRVGKEGVETGECNVPVVVLFFFFLSVKTGE